MTDTLKPCPFCGGNNLKTGGDDKVVGVWCLTCQSAGPNHYGKHEWNDRAALSRPIDPKAEVEPVGYRWRGPKGGWIYDEKKPSGWHSEPVFASPSIVAPVGVEDGWQLVPKEPTQEMLDAVTAADQHEPFSDETMRGIFVDMLAAAPALTPAEKAGVGDGELRKALEWMRDRDDRNGSLPEAYRQKIDAALAAQGDDAQEGTR